MQIEVKKGQEVIYSQMTDDSKYMNDVVAVLMQCPQGTTFVATVTNNGHSLPFSIASVDLVRLVKKVNGIKSVTRSPKAA